MSLPRWWQAWKRPAAAASAAVVMSGVLATAGWAQSPTASERNTTDREDRQQRAGDDERRDRSDSQSQSERVRDEGEQRAQEQRRVQQSGQQGAQQQARQSQQRSDSRDDRDQGQRHDQNGQGQHNQGQHQQAQQQGQYHQSQQRQQQGQSQQGQRRDYSYDRSSQRDQQSHNGLTWSNRNDGRLVVDRIEYDSAWDRIGLADGDRVVSINGHRVGSVQNFNRYYAAAQPGQRSNIVVYRDGDQETLYWTPRQQQQAQYSQNQQHGQAFLGVQLDDRYDESAVVKAVYRNSPAERAGLRPGDTIVALNGQDVSSPHDLTDIVGDMQPGEEVHLQIARRQNLNTQVRLGSRSTDDVRQASFEERERRSYSSDQSNDDDNDDRSSRRDNQRSRQDDDSDRSNNDRSDDDSNQSDD